MGYMGGVAAASSVTQASLKILLHKRLKGPDAEEVRHYCFVVVVVIRVFILNLVAYTLYSDFLTRCAFIIATNTSHCCRDTRYIVVEGVYSPYRIRNLIVGGVFPHEKRGCKVDY